MSNGDNGGSKSQSVINLREKFSQFSEHWSPRQIGTLNDCQITLAKTKGEFVWHRHEQSDELFLVVEGELAIHFRDRTAHLKAGEMLIVPRGVEHKPVSRDECHVLVMDREGTVNTGDEKSDLTVHQYPQL